MLRRMTLQARTVSTYRWSMAAFPGLLRGAARGRRPGRAAHKGHYRTTSRRRETGARSRAAALGKMRKTTAGGGTRFPRTPSQVFVVAALRWRALRASPQRSRKRTIRMMGERGNEGTPIRFQSGSAHRFSDESVTPEKKFIRVQGASRPAGGVEAEPPQHPCQPYFRNRPAAARPCEIAAGVFCTLTTACTAIPRPGRPAETAPAGETP